MISVPMEVHPTDLADELTRNPKDFARILNFLGNALGSEDVDEWIEDMSRKLDDDGRSILKSIIAGTIKEL